MSDAAIFTVVLIITVPTLTLLLTKSPTEAIAMATVVVYGSAVGWLITFLFSLADTAMKGCR